MHVCTLWQVQFLTLYYRCSNPTTANHTYTPPYTHALANTCISTHLPAKHSHTSHINSLASVTAWVGVGSHMYMHAHTHTTTHPETQTQSSCLQWTYPFDPLTGTWRISKWEEKPQSRSTSQRCALSIGSCLTPQDSRGWLCLLQEAITLLSGSEVCLECYLHLSWKEAGAQEVRQEWDHLYHVLCMTCGMCLNIYMCLKVMQIEREKNWEEVQTTLLPLSTKSLYKQFSMMQFQSGTSNNHIFFSIYWSEPELHILGFVFQSSSPYWQLNSIICPKTF